MMLCLHPPLRLPSLSPLLHHPNGAHVPVSSFAIPMAPTFLCSFPLKKAAQLQAKDFLYSSRRSPERRACPAVCFKDEVPLFTAENLGFKDEAPLVAPETSISCTTFNILAPIYKRVNGEGFRESEFRESWLSRNQRILDLLLLSNSSILCLQEFWLGCEELTHLYDENLRKADYLTYKLARTNSRGDGLLTAIKSERMSVLEYKDLLFNDCGDRVAQFFHLRSKVPSHERRHNVETEVLLVNTHLLFPHDLSYCLVRLRQVYKILEFVEQFKIEHGLTSVPVVLCGDWNGSKRGRVYKFLRSQGYLSSYNVAHDYTDTDFKSCISHKNHRGNICEVDFIWLLNPDTYRKPLLVSWHEAVLGTIKAKLSQIGLRGKDAFRFFLSEGNRNIVTLQEFEQGLQQLGLTETCTDACSEGLTKFEIEQLMQVVDLNGNGVIDYGEFEALLATGDADLMSPRNMVEMSILHHDTLKGKVEEATPTLETEKPSEMIEAMPCNLKRWHNFNIEEAFLFPPEVEGGIWPEEYSLSDHAALTVRFALSRTLPFNE